MNIDDKLNTLLESYKLELEDIVLEDEDALKKELDALKKDTFSIDDEDKIEMSDEEQDVDGDGDLDDDDLDVDGDGKIGDEDIAKLLDEEEELSESKVKNAKDILKNRFKKASRKFILDKIAGGKKITPVLLAQFKTNYEYDNNAGRFGKWIRRKNKGEFKQKNPIKNIVKTIKGQAKRMKKMLKKGSIQKKIALGKKKTNIKVSGKTVDYKGTVS